MRSTITWSQATRFWIFDLEVRSRERIGRFVEAIGSNAANRPRISLATNSSFERIISELEKETESIKFARHFEQYKE